jgi:two-component system nitrate/nitrite response regulator NarL
VLPSIELTAREAEILALIDAGLSNKQIAHRLVIELATVKNHVHHILEKLHVHRRAEAAAHLRAGRALGPTSVGRAARSRD